MVIYFTVLCILGGLFLLSGKTKLPEEVAVSGFAMPFYRCGYFLSEHLEGKKLHASAQKKETEKLAGMLMILFFGMGIALMAEMLVPKPEILKEGNILTRPGNGEGDRVELLQAKIEGIDEETKMEIRVGERQYTAEEKSAFLKEALTELDAMILGENRSKDEVRGKIVLPTLLTDGKVSVRWIREPEDLVDADGIIKEDLPREGRLLTLKAILTIEEREAIYETALHLYPPKRTKEEELVYTLRKEIEEEERAGAEKEKLMLPLKVGENSVTWSAQKQSVLGIFLCLTFVLAAAAYIGKEEEYRKKEQSRTRQMVMDYPGLLFKMSMLLSAGLTMQNVFFKIAMEYRDHKKGEERYAYEEMLTSCYEMRSGISEGDAYERFGKRCKENHYIKLGTVLSGNLHKGAQGLTGILQEEAIEAMEERKQLAKKLGEEAGTKLLMPMILMLLVVLIILMVPAVLAF